MAAAGATALLAGAAQAAPLLTSIPIKFAADQPGRTGGDSTVTGPAGVLDTVNWNNTTGSPGMATLSIDQNGVVVAGTPTVDWSSSGNVWSSTGKGEENNTAADEDGDLMAGYLDTNGGPTGVNITVNGLNYANSPFTLGYDVYVYAQGGVNARGGTYTLGDTTIYHETTTAFDGTFIQDTTADASATGPEESIGSNYIVFRNVTGDSFTLTTVPTVGDALRAPVNAIEVVAVPEPASFAALAGGVALLLGVRRRRSA